MATFEIDEKRFEIIKEAVSHLELDFDPYKSEYQAAHAIKQGKTPYMQYFIP